MPHCDLTHEVLWDGPCDLELWSDDEDNICVSPHISKFPCHVSGRTFEPVRPWWPSAKVSASGPEGFTEDPPWMWAWCTPNPTSWVLPLVWRGNLEMQLRCRPRHVTTTKPRHIPVPRA
ncbi:hypothetical protein AVEN_111147-1 [Araneus ventricosus]|uniref:Uncharacterized protein n=1 Tax=Araneus ventricosus TaxID=182803 RepID=A0A4Y2SNR4_ARAVE|nr:hypothetical protein AVEN_111147-1 [Araneus ventricosus]